ncbi:hypothetical protein HNO88_001827 [Novosphingobium chloroacetimidivorans]|uniref:Uncharacterized protein n=1 Tax=Novosphingobium chloroacetimidivorans TaxID=1428314 RepID=A0A7W7KA47_9SPHN|nr:hypothetical protein [Novosphingobium chloroacetimidivorans]
MGDAGQDDTHMSASALKHAARIGSGGLVLQRLDTAGEEV